MTPVHPLHRFKQARRDELHAAAVEERARREGVVLEVSRLLKTDIGDDVVEHAAIECTSLDPPEASIVVQDHIPITAIVVDGRLAFALSRRAVRKTFQHFADALTYGEPYGATTPPPPPPEQSDPTTFDTSTPPTESTDG